MKALILILALVITVQSQSSQNVTVYVYMPEHATTMGRFSGKLYVDNKAVAEINKNRYVVLHLAPGSHSFFVKDKKFGGFETEMQSDQTYYLRVRVEEGGYFMRFRGVESISKEEATFVIKQIKPIRRKDVLDTAVVDMTVVSQL